MPLNDFVLTWMGYDGHILTDWMCKIGKHFRQPIAVKATWSGNSVILVSCGWCAEEEFQKGSVTDSTLGVCLNVCMLRVMVFVCLFVFVHVCMCVCM